MEGPYMKVGIPQISTEEPCMKTGIPTKNQTQIPDPRSIGDLRTQNSDPPLGFHNSESRTQNQSFASSYEKLIATITSAPANLLASRWQQISIEVAQCSDNILAEPCERSPCLMLALKSFNPSASLEYYF